MMKTTDLLSNFFNDLKNCNWKNDDDCYDDVLILLRNAEVYDMGKIECWGIDIGSQNIQDKMKTRLINECTAITPPSSKLSIFEFTGKHLGIKTKFVALVSNTDGFQGVMCFVANISSTELFISEFTPVSGPWDMLLNYPSEKFGDRTVIMDAVFLAIICLSEGALSEDKSRKSRRKMKRRNRNSKTVYKKLIIDFNSPPCTGRAKGGTHASPSFHKRRGHFRHLKSGKKVWIGPMDVGDKKNGEVIKNYRVKPVSDFSNLLKRTRDYRIA